MGVPSYFSYIIKTHASILRKYETIMKNNIRFHRFYMDCNSILYDMYNSMITKESFASTFETELLEKTSDKIEQYIQQINPTDTIYIAFDGVAPFAKMQQQKTRRYRSWFESSLTKTPELEVSSSMFTPGTEFMRKLSVHIKKKFQGKEAKEKFKVNEIIIATPEQAGEGEHKLYEHLRKHPVDETKTIAIYGLDADLIMLSLFHLDYCSNTYIVREAPSFIHAMIEEPCMNPHELLFLDVQKLGNCISSEMNCSYPSSHRMYDYVFLCFLLGNDFLPHFPALNIRTNGIQRLLDVYRSTIGNTQNRYLVSTTRPFKIQWREVTRLFQELAKHEHTFIKQEYSYRKRWDDKTVMHYPSKTLEEKKELINQTPVLYRTKEKFINPDEDNWEVRYYHSLIHNASIKDVCINYLEGLEWVFEYYTNQCMDWRWSYSYHYPPLLKDLVVYVPYGKMTFFEKTNNKPLRPLTQLAFVLPPNLHAKLLPYHVHEILQDQYKHCFPHYEENTIPKLLFDWSFCRYFWEAHVQFPEITREEIEKWENTF